MFYSMLNSFPTKQLAVKRTLLSISEEEGIIYVKRFRELGVNLFINPAPMQFECVNCRERWNADVEADMIGPFFQIFLPGMGERFDASYHCPNGCNRSCC